MDDADSVSNPGADAETARVERIFDRMADGYDRQIGWSERLMLGHARQWAVHRATGDVVELAVGTGLNLPLYGSEANSVVGVDLSERMLIVARSRISAQHLDRVSVRQGDVQRLDLPGESADSVVSTYTFCSIPDPLAAAREAFRILRPGGRFVLAEHGPTRSRVITALMRAAEPLTVRFSADYLTRNPLPYLEQAGFVIDSVTRTGLGDTVFRVIAHKPDHQSS